MRRPSRQSRTTRARRALRLGESLEPRVLLSMHSLIGEIKDLAGPFLDHRQELDVEADSELGDDPHANQVGEDATPLELTDNRLKVSSFIDAAGDVDVFTVTPSVTGRLSIDTNWSDISDGSDESADPETGRRGRWMDWLFPEYHINVDVLNSVGEELPDAFRGASVEAGETYSIVVSASDDTSVAQYALNLRLRETFDFDVAIDSTAGDDPHADEFNDSATPLEFMDNDRAVISSIIDTADDVDVFQFTADETGQIGIRIQRDRLEDGTWMERIRRMRPAVSVNLYDSTGTLISPMSQRSRVNVDVGETYYVAISNRHEFSEPVEYRVGILNRPASIQPDAPKGDDQHSDEAGADSTELTLVDGSLEFSSYLDTGTDVDTFRVTPASDGILNIAGSLAGFGQSVSITVSTADGVALESDRDEYLIACPVGHDFMRSFPAELTTEVVANTEYFITVTSPYQNDGAYTISVELDSTVGDDEDDQDSDDNPDRPDDDVEPDTDDQTQDDDTDDDRPTDDTEDDNTTVEDDTTEDDGTITDDDRVTETEVTDDNDRLDGNGDLTADDGSAAGDVANRLALDVNGDGAITIFEDAMLTARYMAGFRGEALIDGIMEGETAAADVTAQLDALGDRLDADNDGEISVLKDGVMIIRAGAGFTSEAVVAGLGEQFEQAIEMRQVTQRLDDLLSAVITPVARHVGNIVWQITDREIDSMFSDDATWVLK